MRDNEKAARVAAGAPIRSSATWQSPSRIRASGRRAGRLHPHRLRRLGRTGSPSIGRRSRRCWRRRRRPRTTLDQPGHRASSSTRRRCGCSAARRSRWTRARRSIPSPLPQWRVEHENLVLSGEQRATCGPPWCVPGVVYGGGDGHGRRPVQDGDQRPGARDRRRQQSLAARLRSRSRGSLPAGSPANDAASGVFNANDEGDETVNDIVDGHQPVPVASARRAVRADRRSAVQDGAATPTRLRSIRSCAARAPVRSAGARACTRSPAMPHDCSRSGELREVRI